MKKTLEPYQLIERSIIKKYRKELWTPFIVAVKRYELVQADALTMTAGTYSHPDRGTPFDEQNREYQNVAHGRNRGER